MQVPMVVLDGSLPDSPFPCAQTKISCPVTLLGVLPSKPKPCRSMPLYSCTVWSEPERRCFSVRKA